MTKVVYHGKEIELCDKLEPGYMELDLLTDEKEDNDLESTKRINVDSLEDTQIIGLGEKDE